MKDESSQVPDLGSEATQTILITTIFMLLNSFAQKKISDYDGLGYIHEVDVDNKGDKKYEIRCFLNGFWEIEEIKEETELYHYPEGTILIYFENELKAITKSSITGFDYINPDSVE